jgi:hypothetical protein
LPWTATTQFFGDIPWFYFFFSHGWMDVFLKNSVVVGVLWRLFDTNMLLLVEGSQCSPIGRWGWGCIRAFFPPCKNVTGCPVDKGGRIFRGISFCPVSG